MDVIKIRIRVFSTLLKADLLASKLNRNSTTCFLLRVLWPALTATDEYFACDQVTSAIVVHIRLVFADGDVQAAPERSQTGPGFRGLGRPGPALVRRRHREIRENVTDKRGLPLPLRRL